MVYCLLLSLYLLLIIIIHLNWSYKAYTFYGLPDLDIVKKPQGRKKTACGRHVVHQHSAQVSVLGLECLDK